jgi:TolA-binding protein
VLAGLVQLRRPLLISALLLVLAQLAGNAARAMLGRDVPTEEFIAQELDGKSPMAAYYRGLNAYYAHDFAHAREFFARSIGEVPDVKKQARAYLLLGESAFHVGDFRGAAQTLASQPKLTAEQALMLAEARLKLGERAIGFQVLDFVASSYPDDTRVQARKHALEREYQRTE